MSKSRWVPQSVFQCLGMCLFLTICIATPGIADDNGPDVLERKRARAEAVVLWIGLVILLVVVLGIGLIWGVSRGARRILRMKEPTHTEMENIWYENPPPKRKQDDS